MKKCIIIPDSFKGTLSAVQICDKMKQAVLRFFPDGQVRAVPVADGGEGTVDCFVYALGAEKVTVTSTGPFGDEVEASYAKMGDTAVIEMASVTGLPLAEGNLNPRKASTFGLGKLILHAADLGCKNIVIGLGGSCTNDAGTGMVRALGTKFFDKNGNEFSPCADELVQIDHIDNSALEHRLKGISFTVMCDVDNPLYGKNGAAYVFAPQKGADEQCVRDLDQNLRALAAGIEKDLGKKVEDLPGAGAAGGMGAGCVAFLNGTLKAGIETVLELVGFDEMLDGADVVFTGEGKIDSQSLRGKVIMGVASHGKKKGVPVVAVVGAIGEGAEEIYQYGVTSIFSINRTPEDFSVSRYKSEENLERTMESILRLYRAVKK